MDSLKKDHKEFKKYNRLISKIEHRCKSERHKAFAEEINKIALVSNDKKLKSFVLIETYSYRISKVVVSEKRLNVII